MSGLRDGLPRSVQVRLARHARSIGVDPNLVLTRYAVIRQLGEMVAAIVARVRVDES